MSFIKWVGGKSKLIPQIQPKIISYPNVENYLEPFLGSASVLISLLKSKDNKFKNFKANDINKDLITTFNVVKHNPKQLIYSLRQISSKYQKASDKELFYYKCRDVYNDKYLRDEDESCVFLDENGLLDINDDIHSTPSQIYQDLLRATLFIFLNKTCFRGLYRVNKQDEFNVPFGNYMKPTIFNEDEIMEISNLIQNVEFYNEDYRTFLDKFKTKNSVIYLDPPYFGTFNGYSSKDFNHDEFVNYCKNLVGDDEDDKEIHLVISNSKQFYDKYEDELRGFDVSFVDINERMNSKSPNSIRNEVILTK